MDIEEFTLERIQSLYENTVELNLSDSGVHPMSLCDRLLPGDVYGMDGYFRIGIGSPKSHLEPGLERTSNDFRANY